MTQVWGIISLVYVLPVVLILVEVIPFDYKYVVLVGMALGLGTYSCLRGFSWADLGFSLQNFVPSTKRILPVTLGLTIAVLVVYLLGWLPSNGSPGKPLGFYFFYIFVSSPVQEFLYRGFLFHLLSEAGIKTQWRIVTTATLYSFVHIIFRDSAAMVGTLLIGLFWGWVYEKDRNVYSMTISHSILGSLSLLANLD